MGQRGSRVAGLVERTKKNGVAPAFSPPIKPSPQPASPRSGSQHTEVQNWEIKSAEVEKDAGDPQFLKNLKVLGAVPIPDISQQYVPNASRYRQLDDAMSEHNNRISARALSNLFHELRALKSEEEAQILVRSYGMEFPLLKEMVGRFNAPLVHRLDKDDTEKGFVAKWDHNILESLSKERNNGIV
ncbi:hypothetical protein BT69DRAFT_1349800 [Atractiella rhizophila]|nr:hypothetical protein BT69DRAFT_1349800 [Atractiella rhizophila]